MARVVLVLGLIVATVAIWYLHEIGLPEMAKTRIVAKMRAHGWALEFSRIRLHGWEHFVAEDVQLARADNRGGPELLARSVHFTGKVLREPRWHFRLQSIRLDDGTLLTPVFTTNAHARYLLLHALGGELKLQDNDRWELSSLQGLYGNLNFHLSGDLDHASEIRNVKLPSVGKSSSQEKISWQQALDLLKKCQLGGSPQLAGRIHADARDIKSTEARFTFRVTNFNSRWCAATNLNLQVLASAPGDSNSAFAAKIAMACGSALTRWGQAREVRADLDLQFSSAWKLTNSVLAAEISRLKTPWATTAVLQAQAALPLSTNSRARLGPKIAFTARDVGSKWGRGAQAQWQTSASLPPLAELLSTNTTWTERLNASLLTNELNFNNLTSTWFTSDHIRFSTEWNWPHVQAEVTGGIQGGAVTAAAAFNLTNRNVVFRSATDLEFKPYLNRFLPTNWARALADYSGSTSPKLQVQGTTILPPWTNRPFWTAQWPKLSLAGHFDLGAGTYRSMPFNALESSFTLTNANLRLIGLTLTRPEGVLRSDFRTDFKENTFSGVFVSEIDPKIAQVFFPNPKERDIFDQIIFTAPPFLQGGISGAWDNPHAISFTGQARLTNCTVRGETVQSFTGGLQYTNKVLTIFEPVVIRPEGRGSASNVAIDFSQLLLSMTSAESTLEPMAIARVIGPPAVKALQPYQFDSPPHGRVNGLIDLKRRSYREDIHFEIQGGRFRWRNLHLQKASGRIDWVGNTLSLSNVQGEFITGRLDAGARFDFASKTGADFSAQANIVEADLREFLSNWSTSTNRLEGRLNGQLTISGGNTEIPPTWQGFGWVSLRDGLIWDIPMFGLFSPALNTIVPGLGNSRARKASATYIITNGVVSSADLEIHATAMRMQFQGTVDFEQKLNARVEAELLRDVPAIGFVVSKVLWPVTKLFEYKVTGTLGNPKSEPMYVIPKVLLTPLQALKAFKDLFKGPEASPEQK